MSLRIRLAAACPCHVKLIWLSPGFVLFVNQNRQRSNRERPRVDNFLYPFCRMESRHDSVLRSRFPGISKITTFPDLNGTLEGEWNRGEDQEDDGDRPATTSNGEKCPNPSSTGSGERTRNCCYSDIWKGTCNIDSNVPPLFYFRDCVTGQLHCDVTCGLPGQYEQGLNWSLLNWLPLSSTFTWIIRGVYIYRNNIKEKIRWTSTKMHLHTAGVRRWRTSNWCWYKWISTARIPYCFAFPIVYM